MSDLRLQIAPGRKRHRLRGYDPNELSFVPNPANYKKFLINKSKGMATMPNTSKQQKLTATEQQVVDAISALPNDVLQRIDDLVGKRVVNKDDGDPIAPLSAGAQAALKAISRILAPYAAELNDADIDAVQDAIGMNPDEPDEEDLEEDDADAEDLPDADPAEQDDAPEDDAADDDANSIANSPDAILAQAMGDKPENYTQEQWDAAMQAAKAAFMQSLGQQPVVQPVLKSAVGAQGDAMARAKQAIQKSADGDALSKVLAALDRITQDHKQLVEKSALTDKQLADYRAKEEARYYESKASQFADMGDTENIQAIFKAAGGNQELEQKFEQILKSAQAKARTAQEYDGDLFSEAGSRNAAGGQNPEAEMNALVAQCIEKSAIVEDNKKPMTAEKRKALAMKTKEGRALYNRLAGKGRA